MTDDHIPSLDEALFIAEVEAAIYRTALEWFGAYDASQGRRNHLIHLIDAAARDADRDRCS